jgi:alkylation response protein AidB-like acyl-CoA dehydrogenase
MSTATPPQQDLPQELQQEQQSFAETALRLGGKSEEEARRTGALDKADEQVEKLFQPQYQTANSPIHKAIWDGKAPLELFQPEPVVGSHPCEKVMADSLEVVRRHREADTLLDEHGKIHPTVLSELGQAGYWGLLIAPEHGGSGTPFPRFARFITRMATQDAMIAGLASIHGCIGAVDPLRTFGNAEQKARFLPRLASGERLSGFALTEPAAGSDLTALKTTATLEGDHYVLNGEKLFITNVIPGRTAAVVALIDKKPAVLVVDLPDREDDSFRLVGYGLYALRQAHNNGIVFKNFRVPKENLLKPGIGDGLTIAYHGLNLGRLSLCANAAGCMRLMLANMIPWSEYRVTYGQPIARRELVKRRMARLAGLIVASDALVNWGAWLIEKGYRGEMECIIAKIFGSEAQKEAAVELYMKTHGGRSFLKGHLLGDNIYDFLAPCIYEGEGEVLGMAFFKSLVKEHGKQYFEPIGKALAAKKIDPKKFNPLWPGHAWALRGELWNYAQWRLGQMFVARDRQAVSGMDRRLQGHVDFALDQFGRARAEISASMVKHQLKLADRQCRMSELSQRVQDMVTMLVTALHAHASKNETTILAADILCQDLQRKLTGARASDAYFRQVAQLGDAILAGSFTELADVPVGDIKQKYAK